MTLKFARVGEALEASLADADATEALGARLADHLRRGDVIALYGDLGAGKTTLARGLIARLTGETEAPSPTFTLVQTYGAEPAELWHFDLYRLEDPDDVLELGFTDALDDIALIEWPDRLGPYLPNERLDVRLIFAREGRRVRLEGHGAWRERLRHV